MNDMFGCPANAISTGYGGSCQYLEISGGGAEMYPFKSFCTMISVGTVGRVALRVLAGSRLQEIGVKGAQPGVKKVEACFEDESPMSHLMDSFQYGFCE